MFSNMQMCNFYRSYFSRLENLHPDDLFLYTDSDELPRPEVSANSLNIHRNLCFFSSEFSLFSKVLLFLKLYDGFPHLVSFDYIWAVFGFFWQVDPRYLCLNIDVVVSISRLFFNFSGKLISILVLAIGIGIMWVLVLSISWSHIFETRYFSNISNFKYSQIF